MIILIPELIGLLFLATGVISILYDLIWETLTKNQDRTSIYWAGMFTTMGVIWLVIIWGLV